MQRDSAVTGEGRERAFVASVLARCLHLHRVLNDETLVDINMLEPQRGDSPVPNAGDDGKGNECTIAEIDLGIRRCGSNDGLDLLQRRNSLGASSRGYRHILAGQVQIT